METELDEYLLSKIDFIKGDITKLDVDVIVNTTDETMGGYVGLSKQIHDICGKKLINYLNSKYVRINTGSIVKSPGFKLKCKKIIHTVGPENSDKELLSSIYRQCLDYCCNKNYLSIAFPCICVGARGFPRETACSVALKTAKNWLKTYYKVWKGKIIFCCYEDKDYKIYQKYMTLYFPTKSGPITRPLNDKEKDIQNNLKEIEETMRKYFDYKEFHADTLEETKSVISKIIEKNIPDIPEYPNPLPDKFEPINYGNYKLPFNLKDSISSMIYGQAVGDAVGLATELLDKSLVFAYYGISHISYDHYFLDRHRLHWTNDKFVCNDWTDDTDQLILILDSIVRNNGNFDVYDFAKRCKYWINCGFTEVGDLRACGETLNFSNVVNEKDFVKDPLKVSEEIWKKENCNSSSNESVMRTAICAVPFFWDENKVIQNAKLFSKVTNFDPRCSASVVTVVSIICKLLQGRIDIDNIIQESIANGEKEIDDNQKEDYHVYTNAESYDDLLLNVNVRYTFKPMGCGILCLKKANDMINKGINKRIIFQQLIEEVTYEAGDADTNCAVVGAILGCFLKNNFIPDKWLDLRNINFLNERISRVLKLYNL